MENCLVTYQDRTDAKDAKALGIGVSEYKDAKCNIAFSHKAISRETILDMVRQMHTRKRVVCLS